MQATYYNRNTIPPSSAGTLVTEKDPLVQEVTKNIFAPVICDFVGWVLRSAQEKGIKRVYFLARDGWIMYHTAVIIAEKHNIDIELKYLYCSRMSLRNAALNDLGEEAYRYLLEGGFALTPRVILGRLGLDQDERQDIYKDIAYSGDEETEMGKAAASEFCGRLKSSRLYRQYVSVVSARCRKTALSYLQQEGLLSDVPYAIADSGWTGSMQKMFRILTGKKQTGYYFGLYAKPDPADGEFNAYLFDKTTSPFTVSRFNNHLFEALCAAPHGMTVGYRIQEDSTVPLLKEEKSLNNDSLLLHTQEAELYRFASEEYILPDDIKGIKERQKIAFGLLDRLMFLPERNVAEKYGGLKFSDDPAELYDFPLAAPLSETKRLYLLPRLKEKLFRKGKLERPVYWGYATAVLSGKGSFCRLNLQLWEVLWLLKR